MKFAQLFFFILICQTRKMSSGTNLKILLTSYFTGKADTKGLPCVKAAEIALEAANKDETFMPGYEIGLHLEDDGYPKYAARSILNFYRQYLDTKSDIIGVPIGVGSFHSLGALRISEISPHLPLNFISVGGVAAPLKLPGNMFKARAEMMSYSDVIVGFLIHFKWQRLAILSAADSQLGFRVSQNLLPRLKLMNISVAWFENVRNVDSEIAKSLLASESRIIVLPNLERPVANMFLCQLFIHNITGTRFQFIAMNTASFFQLEYIPDMVIDGCSADDLLLQYRQTFFVGSIPFSLSETKISRFNYTIADFHLKFYEKIKGIRPADISYAYYCHDGMLHALMSLENAENAMNMANLSVADIYNQKKGSSVFQYIHQALGETLYRGVRNPDVNFSSIRPNDETIVIQQLNKDKQWTFPYRYENGKVERNWHFSSPWMGRDGQIPKDRPLVLNIEEKLAYEGSVFVSATIGILLLSQLVIMFILQWKHGIDVRMSNLVGCVLLDFSAEMAIVNVGYKTETWVCSAKIVLLVIGSVLLARGLIVVSLYDLFQNKITKQNVKSNNKFQSDANHRISSRVETISKSIILKKLKLIDTISLLLIIVQIPILIIWLVQDGITSDKMVVSTIYNIENDSYTKTSTVECNSKRMVTFCLIFLFLNLVPMIAIALVASVKRWMSWKQCYRLHALALLNSIFMIFLCLVVVISIKSNMGRQVTIAITTIAVSISSTITVLLTINQRLVEITDP